MGCHSSVPAKNEDLKDSKENEKENENENGEDEKEPMLLLDITGSMNQGTSAKDETPRCDTIKGALGILVEALAAHDSAAQKGEEEDEGGLRTVTFAGGTATDIGDLNPDNLKKKWKDIEFSGSTQIVPGWNKLMEVYNEEFGDKPASKRPKLLALVITDGEADDTDGFIHQLEKVKGSVFVNMVIIGFGKDHDDATAQYQRVSAAHKNVTVTQLDANTDPQGIADKLLALLS